MSQPHTFGRLLHLRLKLTARRAGLLRPWQNLRQALRASELGVTLLGVATGGIGAAVVLSMGALAQYLHMVLFRIHSYTRLSTHTDLSPLACVAAPVAGGLLMAAGAAMLKRWRPHGIVDPIEANALHGGRMSFIDSLILSLQTIISNGFGASVGLEAGYTQLSSGLASKLGLLTHLRRHDMRVLVGCGAAGAIAAAFDAPISGAFYAFELIIGSYTLANVAPVMAAAITGTLLMRQLGYHNAPIAITTLSDATASEYIVFVFMGFVCGLAGILLMRGVTGVDSIFRKLSLPVWLRPPVGGLLVGLLALQTPQVLSAGHGAMHVDMFSDLPLRFLIMVFLLKALATSLSLGSGFRGGLFFASLFMGSLLGKILAVLVNSFSPGLVPDPVVAAVICMSALAVAVVGGPLTMGFMALEVTGDYVIAGTALAAAVISSLTVRELFGYSFSTWRMHLRGESIRSAHDIGWVRSLTVGKLMQRNPVTVAAEMSLGEFRHRFPIGSVSFVVAVGPEGRYAGIVWVYDAYATEGPAAQAQQVNDLLKDPSHFLVPEMNIRQAIRVFDETASEALAVLNEKTGEVLGLLSEAFALRRYTEEFEQVRRSLEGVK
jgi:CIC family chloride channel protein